MNPEGVLARNLIALGVEATVAFHIPSIVTGPTMTTVRCIELLVERYEGIDQPRLTDAIQGYVRHSKLGF